MNSTNKNILKDYIRKIILDEGYAKDKKLPPMRNELYWLIHTIDADEKDILYDIEHSPRVTARLIRELDELGYETEFLEYLNTILPKNHKRYNNVDEFADYVIAGDFWTTDFRYDFIDTFNDFLVNTLNDKGVKNKKRIYPGERERSDIKDMIGYAQSAGGINAGNTKQSFSNNYNVLRNEWLIHFTDRQKMYGILNNGFRYGVSDPQGLALTKHIDHEKKEDKAGSGVYVFAFPANNSPDPRYPIYGDKKRPYYFGQRPLCSHITMEIGKIKLLHLVKIYIALLALPLKRDIMRRKMNM
jgi:hypothetical protein